ncbi:MAG TPA: hypothetical protein VF510_23440 [Ktedonobacterales bacterium]
MSSTRKPYPSDVSDDDWAFVAPYLAFACLMLHQFTLLTLSL